MNEKLVSAAIFSGAVAARANLTALSTVVLDHRIDSHASADTSEVIKKIMATEQKFSSTNHKEWGATHRICHHQFPDADLYPFWIASHAIDNAQKRGLEIPNEYRGYDPHVKSFDLDEVCEIGVMANEYLVETFGDQFGEPDFANVSNDALEDILYSAVPKFYYDERFFNRNRPFTLLEQAHILLRDQHAPALAPPNSEGTKNGVRYVMKHNIRLSNVPTRLIRQSPHLMPEDLRPDNPDIPIESNADYVIAGFLISSLMGMALRRGEYSIDGLVKSGVAGSLVNLMGLVVLKEGSSVVNSFGHMGVMTPETIRAAMFNKDFELIPYPDGKLSSDTETGGFIGKFLSLNTFMESGWQNEHHLHPELVDFSKMKKGRSIDTLFGRALDKIVDSPLVPFIRRGKGLPLNKYGRRPDEQHPAVDIIQEARVRTMKQEA